MQTPELTAAMAQALRDTPETLRHEGNAFSDSSLCACAVLYAVGHGQTVEEFLVNPPKDESDIYGWLHREAALEAERIWKDNDGITRAVAPTWAEMADKLLAGEYDYNY